MANNVQNVKFLRNGSLFDTRELAKNGMLNQINTLADGTAILGRYKGSEYTTDATDVVTLVGFVFNDGTNKSITFFDIEGASADVETLRQEINAKLGDGISSSNTATAQLTALSGTSSASSADTSVWGAKKYASAYTDAAIANLDVTAISAGDGAFIKSVSQADGKVSATTADMPTVGVISETGKAIISVSQTKGTISASAGNIDSQYVNVSYSAITATDVKAALAEIADEINGMDKSASAADGQVVTTVSEVDGVVSETKANVKDLQLGGYSKSSSSGAIASTDTINEALSKLENKAAAITVTPKDKSIVVETTGATTEVGVNIRSGEKVLKLDTDATSGGVYTALDLVKITSDLPAEIKERYQFKATDGSVIGANIDIPKDSHIVSITYITDSGDTHYQNLEYKYVDASGNTQTTYVNMSSLVIEAEFASGITFSDGVAHGVVDSTSEKDSQNTAFLTVGADGFKISGINDEIERKINALDAIVTGGTTAGTATSNHVQVIVGEANGKLTGVTVSETNIANASDLDELSGKSVTAVEMTGGTATTASTTDGTKKITINADGSSIKMTGYAKGSASGAVEATDSVNAAIGKLENQIAGQIDALDATVSGETADGKVNVKVTETNGVITAVNVVGTDIASASALTAEIAARKAVDGQNGDTYAANTSSPYISGATSLNDADVKLAGALKSLSDTTVNEVQVNGYALTETNNAVNVQISAAAGTGAASTPITVDTNSSTGAVTLKLEGLDCGTY